MIETPAACSGATTSTGDPTLVITKSTPCFTIWSMSSAMRRLPRMMRFTASGPTRAPAFAAAARSAWMRASHSSSSPTDSQFRVGNDPATPATQAAAASSGPDTPVMGAQMSGSGSAAMTSAMVAKEPSRGAIPPTPIRSRGRFAPPVR